jgi:hypothetical protein
MNDSEVRNITINKLSKYTSGFIGMLSFSLCTKENWLTLIRAAGGVYDFRNFEEV